MVDDDPEILEVMKLTFEVSFPSVRLLIASSGAEALEIMRREPVDLLITDFRMPGMTGVDLAREAVARRARLPVVMITAFAGDEVRETAVQAGVREFLGKPFDYDVFIDTVSRYLPVAG